MISITATKVLLLPWLFVFSGFGTTLVSAFHQLASSSTSKLPHGTSNRRGRYTSTAIFAGGLAPAVLDRPAIEKKERTVKKRKYTSHQGNGDSWEVRIYNDGMNTREHVARSLVQITGLTEMMAYRTMMQAHQNGIAIVGQFCLEIAELYNEGLRKQGIVSDIVPVDEDATN